MTALAVVGTDTGVGKTVACAVLLTRWAAHQPAYWKPVATGARDERDTDTIRRLCPPEIEILPESYLLAEPLSPHLAARREGATIDPGRLLADLLSHRATLAGRPLVVEGAGGVLVPLTDDGYLLADLLAAAALPCLVVARSTLGTINHTLLTLEALRSRKIQVKGVVLNGPRNPDNRHAIERFGAIQVVGELPPLPMLTPAAISAAAPELRVPLA